MGQYYVIAFRNPEDKSISYISPSGIKMMEHAYIHNTSCKKVFKYLYNKPMHVAWVGDYACASNKWDNKKKEWIPCHPYINVTRPHLYSGEENKDKAEFILNAWEGYWDIDYDFRKHIVDNEVTSDIDPEKLVIVNKTKKLFINVSHYTALFTEENKYCVNPLAILCDTSQEDAGGDYHGINMWASGMWVGDEIYTTDKEEFINSNKIDNYDVNYEEFLVPFTDTGRHMNLSYFQVIHDCVTPK